MDAGKLRKCTKISFTLEKLQNVQKEDALRIVPIRKEDRIVGMELGISGRESKTSLC